jgi:hypothetical protein
MGYLPEHLKAQVKAALPHAESLPLARWADGVALGSRCVFDDGEKFPQNPRLP